LRLTLSLDIRVTLPSWAATQSARHRVGGRNADPM